jgi:hypothetical protein
MWSTQIRVKTKGCIRKRWSDQVIIRQFLSRDVLFSSRSPTRRLTLTNTRGCLTLFCFLFCDGFPRLTEARPVLYSQSFRMSSCFSEQRCSQGEYVIVGITRRFLLLVLVFVRAQRIVENVQFLRCVLLHWHVQVVAWKRFRESANYYRGFR